MSPADIAPAESPTNGDGTIKPRKDLVSPATRRAITLARVCFALPAPVAYVSTLIMVAAGPFEYEGLTEPQHWWLMPEYSPLYWAGNFLGGALYFASMLLQAYGKRPEIEQVGVDGTDRIFTWDAIFELTFFIVTMVAFACHAVSSNEMLMSDRRSFLIISNFLMGLVGFVAIFLFVKSIINTKRERLTQDEFKAWAIKQAAVIVLGVAPIIIVVVVYVSINLGYNSMHHAHVDWSGNTFERLSLSLTCANETVALDAIASLECPVPLCGYDSWQTVCHRAQVSEGIRAFILFVICFPFHLLLMWAVVVLYSHGVVIARGTDAKASYIHLLHPHMLVVGILLLYVNLLELYQLGRIIVLGPFLMYHERIDKVIKLPGTCYGSCATWVIVGSFAVSWIAIVLILNFDRFRSLIVAKSERAKEKEERNRVEKDWEKDSTGHLMAPTFYFMQAEYVSNLKDLALPRFQELMKREPPALEKKRIKLTEAFRGEGDIKSILFISHRWEEQAEPDRFGLQLKAIKEHLKENPDIKWVWYDYSCMPQKEQDGTDKRSVPQMVEFGLMLSAIADLYMTSFVLILLDKLYDSRFWTLTESWCAMQQADAKGLQPAESGKERYTIKLINEASEGHKTYLINNVSKLSERELRAKLAGADVNVTNMKDKETMLPIIQKMNDHVIEIMKSLAA